MNKHKLRAWKDGKVYYGTPIFNKLGCFLATEDNPHLCDQYGYIEIDEFVEIEATSLERYTGLKDKQGFPYYENDIAKQEFVIETDFDTMHAHYVGRVVIIPSRGVCLKDPIFYQPREQAFQRKGYYNLRSYRSWNIGNIHRHPDYLELEEK